MLLPLVFLFPSFYDLILNQVKFIILFFNISLWFSAIATMQAWRMMATTIDAVIDATEFIASPSKELLPVAEKREPLEDMRSTSSSSSSHLQQKLFIQLWRTRALAAAHESLRRAFRCWEQETRSAAGSKRNDDNSSSVPTPAGTSMTAGLLPVAEGRRSPLSPFANVGSAALEECVIHLLV